MQQQYAAPERGSQTCADALNEAWRWALMGPTAEPVVRAARDLCDAQGSTAQQLEAAVIDMLSAAYYMPREQLGLALQRIEDRAKDEGLAVIVALAAVARCHLLMAASDAARLTEAAEAVAADPAVQSHPLLACLNLWHQMIGAFWSGRHEQALRLAHDWAVKVTPLGMPHQQATALCALGYLHSAGALQYESGLAIMRRAREIERELPVNRWSSTISARCLETMLWAGQPAAAMAQLQQDLQRPGMLRALQGRHATVARVYLANGDLDQAEEWLGQLGADQPAQPFLAWQWRLTKVLLLNARGRHREAAELAQAELARAKAAVPPPADMVCMFQALHEAHTALGDHRLAEEAEARGQAYLWPALATAARSAYLSIWLDAAGMPGSGAEAGSAGRPAPAVPAGRQRSIDQAVQGTRAEKVPVMLAQVSHEIRSPLAGVIGLAGLLELSTLDQRQRRWVNALSHSARWMLVVVNDVLDLARLQSGRVALHPVSFDWRQLLAETCALVDPLIGPKPLALRWQCDDAIGPAWTGDPNRLRQVLHNLLSNAVKFTSEGTVQVFVRPASQGAVRIEVQDTGRGIAPAAQARLFQPFEQAVPDTDGAQGSGLGLALCRQLVRLMGGEMGVISSAGAGSLFWFEVPALPAHPAKA